MTSVRADAVVVGAGVAGLTTALHLPPGQRVVVLCKTALGSGAATAWAQGGIAAAIGDDDSPTLHELDTIKAGAGIGDERAIDLLATDAGTCIAELLSFGAAFDRTESGSLALGLEGGHSRRRVVKSGGDATGHEVLRTLVREAQARSNIRIVEYAHADDLILDGDTVSGVHAHDVRSGVAFNLLANATVLASGGCGRLFRYTTNPAEATGDGIAIAARAGALLADMEFVQFHPTALAIDRDPLPLVTEALRGEGAVLRNDAGHRFMPDLHRDAELAPRDVVARAIFEQQVAGHSVRLDATELGKTLADQFPTVFETCMKAGIDPRVSAIPVTPAAHYMIGGVAVNEWGRASLPGLWACGETCATGIHGANRLASNSLLEALVFAARVASDIEGTQFPLPRGDVPVRPVAGPVHHGDAARIAELRALMYASAGLKRNGPDLSAALSQLDALESGDAPSAQLRNLLTIARLVVRAALDRTESRGCHYREDYPHAEAAWAHRSFTRLAVVAS